MSNLVFPPLTGIKIGVTRKAIFKTDIQEASSGAEFRLAKWGSHRWRWRVSFDILLDDGTATGDFEKLMGLFIASGGAQDSFLFSPPDRTLTEIDANQMTGDAATGAFLLRMPLGAGWEYVRELDSALLALTVKVNGVTTAVTVTSEDGIVKCTFASAPAAAAVVTASFGYRYRVRFADDTLEVETWARNIMRQKGLELIQVFA